MIRIALSVQWMVARLVILVNQVRNEIKTYKSIIKHNIMILCQGGHCGVIDDTSSDDQEATRLEDALLENIDMLSDKRYLLYCLVCVNCCLVVQKTDCLGSHTLIKCFVKR